MIRLRQSPLSILIKYPKASMYAPTVSVGQGNPYSFGAPKCMIGTQGITTDTSHEPALNYLPFMLTGDPYYLEGLQFQAVYDLLATSVGYRYSTNQVRSASRGAPETWGKRRKSRRPPCPAGYAATERPSLRSWPLCAIGCSPPLSIARLRPIRCSEPSSAESHRWRSGLAGRVRRGRHRMAGHADGV